MIQEIEQLGKALLCSIKVAFGRGSTSDNLRPLVQFGILTASDASAFRLVFDHKQNTTCMPEDVHAITKPTLALQARLPIAAVNLGAELIAVALKRIVAVLLPT
jgi:hypothetical protein